MQIQRKYYFEISRTYFLTVTTQKWLPVLHWEEIQGTRISKKLNQMVY